MTILGAFCALLCALATAGRADAQGSESAPPAVSSAPAAAVAPGVEARPAVNGGMERQRAVVPLVPLPGSGCPLLTVRINGSATGRFLLDTGTEYSYISLALVHRLGLRPFGADPGSAMAAPGETVRPDLVELGTVPIREKFVVLAAGYAARVPGQRDLPVDGVLGADLLSTCAIQLDFERQRCVVYMPGGLTLAEVAHEGFGGRSLTPVPMPAKVQSNGSDRYVAYTASVRVNDTIAYSLLIDTASALSVFPQQLQAISFGERRLGNHVPVEPHYSGAPQALSIYRVDPVCLGSMAVTSTLAGVYDAPTSDETEVLGVDVLAHAAILLDAQNNAIYVRSAASPTNAFLAENDRWWAATTQPFAQICGLTLHRSSSSGRWTVSRSGPADVAAAHGNGLRSGDDIVAVDGQPASGLTFPQIAPRLWMPDEGDAASVSRASREKTPGQQHTVSIMLRNAGADRSLVAQFVAARGVMHRGDERSHGRHRRITVVPFQALAGSGSPVVIVTIGRSATARFLIDTGTSVSLIKPARAITGSSPTRLGRRRLGAGRGTGRNAHRHGYTTCSALGHARGIQQLVVALRWRPRCGRAFAMRPPAGFCRPAVYHHHSRPPEP